MGDEKQLFEILVKALKCQLSVNQILHIASVRRNNPYKKTRQYPKASTILSIVIVLLLMHHNGSFVGLYKERCIIAHSLYTLSVTRPVTKCSFCQNITKIDIVDSLSTDQFITKYAYTGRPILIKNAASNWLALKSLNFSFLKTLYDTTNFYAENKNLGCQFFSYKTRFTHLKQIFHMKEKTRELLKDDWYVGWSNCLTNATYILQQYYTPPAFMQSTDYDAGGVVWLFMGGGGSGADMHIDSVKRPSWQALINGAKTWYLKPPPECEHICKQNLNLTAYTGDVFVIDTNRWFHSTFIHPPTHGLNIAIGSEYD